MVLKSIVSQMGLGGIRREVAFGNKGRGVLIWWMTEVQKNAGDALRQGSVRYIPHMRVARVEIGIQYDYVSRRVL